MGHADADDESNQRSHAVENGERKWNRIGIACVHGHARIDSLNDGGNQNVEQPEAWFADDVEEYEHVVNGNNTGPTGLPCFRVDAPLTNGDDYEADECDDADAEQKKCCRQKNVTN